MKLHKHDDFDYYYYYYDDDDDDVDWRGGMQLMIIKKTHLSFSPHLRVGIYT